MKRVLIVLLMMVTFFVYAENRKGKLEVGDKAVLTDVNMLDISGEKISIEKVNNKNGILGTVNK